MKALGFDGIPPVVFKNRQFALKRRLLRLFLNIWKSETMPTDLRNAIILPLFKEEGSKSDCNACRGISLLSIAGKEHSKLMFTLVDSIIQELLSSFRHGSGIANIIFDVRQIQEK